MRKEDYANEQGKCPRCKSENLDYFATEYVENMCHFDYKCEDCGQEGEEWYDLVFAGHNVIKEDGETIEL